MAATSWTLEASDAYTIQRRDNGLVTITCLRCQVSSTHPMHVAERYCPCCGCYHRESGLRRVLPVPCPHGGDEMLPWMNRTTLHQRLTNTKTWLCHQLMRVPTEEFLRLSALAAALVVGLTLVKLLLVWAQSVGL